MDDATDDAINRIEKRIIAERDPEPCDDYQATSKPISLCSFCGWDDKDHK